MQIDTNVIKKNEKGDEFYDKFSIAQIIGHIVIGGETSCSMIESGVLNDCKVCNLKNICRKNDDNINKMKDASTVIHKEFKF